MKEYPKKYGAVVQAGKHMSATTVEYINGIEVIKAFNQSAASYGKFTDAVRQNTDLILDWMKSTQGYSALMMTIWPAVLIGVLPIGCVFYRNGSLTAPDFITIAILSLGIVGPLVGAIFLTDDFSKIATITGEIGAVLSEPDLKRPEQRQNLQGLDIDLRNVTFAYKDTQVLNGVTLNIKQGTTTALVGPSGSGKSTIAKLIASYWDADGGSITIGGMDVKKMPPEQVMDLIGYVSQDNFLFNVSVRDNTLVRPDLFFRGTILSGHMYNLLCGAYILHHTGGLHKTWDSLSESVGQRWHSSPNTRCVNPGLEKDRASVQID